MAGLSRVRIALLLAVVTWASSFPMIRIGLDGFTPTHLVLLRYLVASLVFVGYAIVRRVELPPVGETLKIAGLGVLGIDVYGLLLSYGERDVAAGTASLLIASSPVWMVVLATAFSGERPTRAAMLSVLVSFLGAALIATAGGVSGLDRHALAIVGAAMVGALYSVFLRPFTARHGAAKVTLIGVWGSTLALLPAGAGLGHALVSAPLSATAAIVYLGIFPGALGYAAWAYGSARTSAAQAGIALYLVPVVAMVLSNWLLGEVPALIALVGGALILGGVIALHARTPKARAVPQGAVRAVRV